MVINTNKTASIATRMLEESFERLSKSLNRLTSGTRIASPQDDVGGLAQSIKLGSESLRNKAVVSNLTNSLSMEQTKAELLEKVTQALERMSELAMLSQDISKTSADRANYNTEFTELKSYIEDIKSKKFNGVSLFSSSSNNVVKDANGNTFTVTGTDLSDLFNTITGISLNESYSLKTTATTTDFLTSSAAASDGATSISVQAIPSALSSGDVILFEDNARFTLDADAAIGATSLTGSLSGALASGKEGGVQGPASLGASSITSSSVTIGDTSNTKTDTVGTAGTVSSSSTSSTTSSTVDGNLIYTTTTTKTLTYTDTFTTTEDVYKGSALTDRIVAWGDNNHGQLSDMKQVLYEGTLTINNSSGYSAGLYDSTQATTSITVDALSSALSVGDIITFANGGIFVVTEAASSGATAIKGYLTGASVSNDETGYIGVFKAQDGNANDFWIGKGSDINQISAGGFHSLALTSAGVIKAWGAGESGDTNSNAVHYGQSTVPSISGTVTKIEAGGFHSMALSGDGVTTWGAGTTDENSDANHNDGQSNNDTSMSGKTITDIAAGWEHSLALDSNDDVHDWGQNAHSQSYISNALVSYNRIAAGFEQSVLTYSSNELEVAINAGYDDGQNDLDGFDGVSSISAGGFHTMALGTYTGDSGSIDVSGTRLYSSGNDTFNQITDTPGEVTDFKSDYSSSLDTYFNTDGTGKVSNDTDFTSIDGGLYHSVAIKGGEVYAWGAGDTDDSNTTTDGSWVGGTTGTDPTSATNVHHKQSIEPDLNYFDNPDLASAGGYHSLAKGDIKTTANVQTSYTKTYTSTLTTLSTSTNTENVSELKSALQKVANLRATTGANISRLEEEISGVWMYDENLQQAISRITDTNIATEATNFARHKILVQSASTIINHVNLMPQRVMQLIETSTSLGQFNPRK